MRAKEKRKSLTIWETMETYWKPILSHSFPSSPSLCCLLVFCFIIFSFSLWFSLCWREKLDKVGSFLQRFALAHNYFYEGISQKCLDKPTFAKPKIIFSAPWKWQALNGKFTFVMAHHRKYILSGMYFLMSHHRKNILFEMCLFSIGIPNLPTLLMLTHLSRSPPDL